MLRIVTRLDGPGKPGGRRIGHALRSVRERGRVASALALNGPAGAGPERNFRAGAGGHRPAESCASQTRPAPISPEATSALPKPSRWRPSGDPGAIDGGPSGSYSVAAGSGGAEGGRAGGLQGKLSGKYTSEGLPGLGNLLMLSEYTVRFLQLHDRFLTLGRAVLSVMPMCYPALLTYKAR